jgi:hypothetical protein
MAERSRGANARLLRYLRAPGKRYLLPACLPACLLACLYLVVAAAAFSAPALFGARAFGAKGTLSLARTYGAGFPLLARAAAIAARPDPSALGPSALDPLLSILRAFLRTCPRSLHNLPNPTHPHPHPWRIRMMISLANVHTTTAVLPPRLIFHGKEGSGKTTLAAQFPSPIFLQTEEGCPAGLSIATFGLLASYDDVISAIAALGNESHSYQTVVIDSVDVLEPLVWNATCVNNNWKSIESAGYGRGYVEADKFWQDFTAGLDWLRCNRGMNVVLIAHSAVETFNDPRAQSYTSYQLRLHKRGRALLQDWADGIGFLSTELVIHTEDQGFKKRTRADGGSARYLHWEGKPAFTAKNRYALPAKMLVPEDFDFDSQLAPYFPTRAASLEGKDVRNTSSDGGNSAGAGVGAGDGATTVAAGASASGGDGHRHHR